MLTGFWSSDFITKLSSETEEQALIIRVVFSSSAISPLLVSVIDVGPDKELHLCPEHIGVRTL